MLTIEEYDVRCRAKQLISVSGCLAWSVRTDAEEPEVKTTSYRNGTVRVWVTVAKSSPSYNAHFKPTLISINTPSPAKNWILLTERYNKRTLVLVLIKNGGSL